MTLLLRGADHPDLGSVVAQAVDADLAIALTRGRHAKAYRHVDPNEDAVSVRDGAGGVTMVVADGHGGVDASHLAVEAEWDPEAIRDRRAAVRDVHAIDQQILGSARGRRRPRTTLAVAVVAEGGLTYLAVGDSPVLLVRDGVVRALTRDGPHFLGDGLGVSGVATALEHGWLPVDEGDVVVLVTDGYTNFAPLADLARIVEVEGDAAAIAVGIIRRAGEGGAGDNVAAAVLRVRGAGAR